MTVIELLYNLSNVIIGVAFLPQIATLVRRPSRDKSLNLITCALFTLCTYAMLAYAIFHAHDTYFTLSALINVTGWTSILTLASYNRYLRPAPAAKDDFMVGL